MLTSIKLGREKLTVTNAVAYYFKELIMALFLWQIPSQVRLSGEVYMFKSFGEFIHQKWIIPIN